MHAIHHLPLSEHKRAYLELLRVLKPGRSGVVVSGWHRPLIARLTRPFIQFSRLITGRPLLKESKLGVEGTFVDKMTPDWFKREMTGYLNYTILVWRSLSPRILMNFINPKLGGKTILSIFYWLEEKFPAFFGMIGVYPLIVFKKD
jgi:hypothetical protein